MAEEVRRPKGLLLDFYGTLVEEDEGPIVDVCKEIADLADGPVDWQDLGNEWWRIFSELCETSHDDTFLLEKEIERRTFEIVLERYDVTLPDMSRVDTMYEHWKTPAIFPETRDVLAKCDIPMSIVSNIDNDALEAAMAFHNLSFELVVTSEDLKSYKPRPELFLKGLELLGMEATEVLHVGDSLFSDVRGAKELGIPVLWIDNRGKTPKSKDEQPDFASKDLNGLLAILDGRSPEL
jgi:2-haloacid dehalogenase/putative hydrolase of the HAD superfamily